MSCTMHCRSIEDMRRQVDSFVAKLESAAELDMEAHTERKPAINKLKMVPEVEQVCATACTSLQHAQLMHMNAIALQIPDRETCTCAGCTRHAQFSP